MPKRRDFLRAAAAAAAVATPACRKAPGDGRVLNAAELRTLSALCECIIPSDQDPGAAWAGVPQFIDLQLAKPYRRHRAVYREGLAKLDQAAAAKFGKPFADVPAASQNELLQSMESDPFFTLVISHTMQGYYGDPRHGGNRDRVSWKMCGVPGPPVRGRIPYDFNEKARS